MLQQKIEKVPCTVAMAPRQIAALTKVGNPMGITMQEMIRRLVDAWMRDGAKEI